MYDDVDLSGGLFDFDGGGGPLMSQPDSVYVDDEELYPDDLYYGAGRERVSAELLQQMASSMSEAEAATYYERISVSELIDQCIGPTLGQAASTIYPLLALCFICRLTCLFCHHAFVGDPSGKQLASFTTAMLGVAALHSFYQQNIIYVLTLAVLVYPLILLTHSKCRGLSGVSVCVVTLVYLLTCELAVVKRNDWHQIRGAQMVLAMKLISLGFDLDSGTARDLPSVFEYAGYLFHVGSVIFGPWISFHDYSTALMQPEERIFDFYWVWKLVTSLCASMACVLMSTCIAHWALLDTSFVWLMAFRDALSFRFSHYFVCFLSEVTLTLTGHGGTKSNGDTKWDLTTTRVTSIEFPRSLVEVVTSWHLPMHQWLKTYVFKTARPLGNFVAILLTYVASSVLHGVNFQLSAVLLSLGVYTYVEYSLRKRLSEAFSACIQSRRCKADCQHVSKSTNIYVILTNVCFSCLAMFHLTYLGLMFDSSDEQETGYSMEHTLSKWQQLGFASHWVAAALYFFYLLI